MHHGRIASITLGVRKWHKGWFKKKKTNWRGWLLPNHAKSKLTVGYLRCHEMKGTVLSIEHSGEVPSSLFTFYILKWDAVHTNLINRNALMIFLWYIPGISYNDGGEWRNKYIIVYIYLQMLSIDFNLCTYSQMFRAVSCISFSEIDISGDSYRYASDPQNGWLEFQKWSWT